MSVQKYLQMREKWLKKFVKFLNPDAVVVLRLSINLLVLSTSTVLVTTSTSVEQLSCGSSPLFDDLFGKIATECSSTSTSNTRIHFFITAYYRKRRFRLGRRVSWP